MTVAGFEIIACPACRELYKQPIIMSFNTFFAIYYSDGYMDGAGIPNFTPVIKCRNCAKFFKRQEAEKIGEILYDEGWDSYPAEWQNAIDIDSCQLTEEELEEALNNGFCTNEETETTLRYHLLHAYNHAWRKLKSYGKNEQLEHAGFMANCNRLLDLLEKSSEPEQELLIADLYRQTGNFEKCLDILERIGNKLKDEKRQRLEQIYSQAKMRDAKVINFNVTAVKKEFRCNQCGHSLILFDHDRLLKFMDYRYFICKPENRVFNAAMKKINQEPYHSSGLLNRLFRRRRTWKEFVPAGKIHCPHCKSGRVEPFTTSQKCMQCGTGSYKTVKWFHWIE